MASRNISVRLQVEGGAFKAELIEAGRTGQQALKQIETGANQASAALEKTAASAQKTDRESQQLARSAERLKRQYADGYQTAQEQTRATDLLGKGLSVHRIASELTLNNHTVRVHLGNIMRKMRLLDRSAVIHFAVNLANAPRNGSV